MKINPVQCYSNNNQTNFNTTSKNQSFGTIHYSEKLVKYFREKEVPADKLLNVKNNSKNISKAIYEEWLSRVTKKYYKSQYGQTLAEQICYMVANDMFDSITEKSYYRKVRDLATDERILTIVNKYANNARNGANEIFKKHGEDFDIDLFNYNDWVRGYEFYGIQYLKLLIPNFVLAGFEVGGGHYRATFKPYSVKDYENVLFNKIEAGSNNFDTFKIISDKDKPNPDESDLVKELNAHSNNVDESATKELRQKITEIANEIKQKNETDLYNQLL